MAQYIDKDVLLAEIKKYKNSSEAYLKYHHNRNDKLVHSFEQEKLVMCELLSFINTLEAKEVDVSNICDKLDINNICDKLEESKPITENIKLPKKYETCDWMFIYHHIGLTDEHIKRLSNAINILKSINEHTDAKYLKEIKDKLLLSTP